jgi:hypothetical protein
MVSASIVQCITMGGEDLTRGCRGVFDGGGKEGGGKEGGGKWGGGKEGGKGRGG